MTPERVAEFPVPLKTALENYSLGFLRQGRKEWDVPHTRAVVHYAELIARKEDLDVLVLVSAAWLYDIGYYGQFKPGESEQFGEVMDRKKAHMLEGAKMAAEFLERPEIQGFYTPEQRARIIHLVKVHDNIEDLRQIDEIALMEADTLGAIDIERVKPTFNKEDGRKYIAYELTIRRFGALLTKTGVELYYQLFPKFYDYFKKLDS